MPFIPRSNNKISLSCSKSDFTSASSENKTVPRCAFLIFSVQTNSDFKIGLESGLESDF